MRAIAQHPEQSPAPFYGADIQFRSSVLLGPGPRTGGILLINETCIPRDTLYLRATCAKQTLWRGDACPGCILRDSSKVEVIVSVFKGEVIYKTDVYNRLLQTFMNTLICDNNVLFQVAH